MANFLFVHQNFPGQFRYIAPLLAEQGHQVVEVGEETWVKKRPLLHPKMKVVAYPKPQVGGQHTHHYLRDHEGHLRRGQAVFRVAMSLKNRGFKPDVVFAHPGWGEALFLKEAFPAVQHFRYLEYFFQAEGGDIGFDPSYPLTVDDLCKVKFKNTTQLHSFAEDDQGVSPTAWQKSRYPASWQSRIWQIHEGVNTDEVAPDSSAQFSVRGLSLSKQDEVITYVARNLEPYRGFATLMQAIPEILVLRPQAQIVIVGGDDVSYGRRLQNQQNYREYYQQYWPEQLDYSRVHFLGRLPYLSYLKLLQISSLHIYLTYPFVLSWSMLEAMSAGCLVLGSSTTPVREVIEEGKNGFLTDFFDASQLAQRASELLQNRASLTSICHAARETVLTCYDQHRVCLPQMLRLLTRG